MISDTYHNIQANPYATYLFVEEGTGYSGIRLYLKRIKEDNDSDLIARMTRSGLSPQEDKAKGGKTSGSLQDRKNTAIDRK